MRFEDKTIVVTGGASSIGAATVKRFASEGAKIVVADYDTNKANSLLETLHDANKEAYFVAVDSLR